MQMECIVIATYCLTLDKNRISATTTTKSELYVDEVPPGETAVLHTLPFDMHTQG